jgi:selenium metabolism protein YedF
MSTMYVISGDSLGRGDDSLGRRLMVKFVQQLTALTPQPHAVAFYNAGVNLLVPSSPVVDAFRTLEADGVDLMACATCLDHFQVRDTVVVGRASDMREIMSAMATSEKVIVV